MNETNLLRIFLHIFENSKSIISPGIESGILLIIASCTGIIQAMQQKFDSTVRDTIDNMLEPDNGFKNLFHFPFGFDWLGYQDSNLNYISQSDVCCHYTISQAGLKRTLPRGSCRLRQHCGS